MALTKNTWHLDTCGCIVEYTFDNSLPTDQITHYFFSVLRACAQHSPLTAINKTKTANQSKEKEDKLALLAKMDDENKQRNLKRLKVKHLNHGSDGSKSIWETTEVENEDGSIEMVVEEIPPVDRIERLLEKRKNDHQRFYSALFERPFSLSTDVFNTGLEENKRKNNALQVALDNGPTSLYDLAGTSRVLKPAITYSWTWSGTPPNRVLSMAFIGVSLTNAQKNTIRNALNTRFGSGKVTLA